MWSNGTLTHTRWDYKLEWPYWKSLWRYLLKANIVTSKEPGITETPTYTHTRDAYLWAPPKTYTHGCSQQHYS